MCLLKRDIKWQERDAPRTGGDQVTACGKGPVAMTCSSFLADLLLQTAHSRR